MSSDKSKERKIKTELNKLKKIFANVPENKKKITENLLKNAVDFAFGLSEATVQAVVGANSPAAKAAKQQSAAPCKISRRGMPKRKYHLRVL